MATAIALALITGVIGVLDHHAPAPSGSVPLRLGVLEADPRWLVPDTAAGVRVAVLNVSWAVWEPAAGTTDTAYRDRIRTVAAGYDANGWTVSVDPGLQSPPAWALGLPGGQLVDQDGRPSATADFEFSRPVRTAAERYLSDLVATLGRSVNAYRVGLSENGETLYPDTSSNQWWAFSTAAQHGGPDLPPGVAATPLPGWVPGTSQYQGRTIAEADVRRWYDWYFGAMVNALAWEIATYRLDRFPGALDLVMPGTGAFPHNYDERLADDLRPIADDSYSTMNTAAVWWRLLDALPDLRGVTVDVSSVYDGSGAPRGNACRSADPRVDYQHDRAVEKWSDTRWLAALSARHGLGLIGENPGNTAPEDVAGVVRLARGCHLGALEWAWDYQLHGVGATPSNPLASLASVSSAAAG